MEININCDLGEKSKHHSNKYDPDLLEIVNSANIACGFHAGDEETMHQVIEISKKNNVSIGAHPGFKDKKNFGRKRIYLTLDQIDNLITSQLELIYKISKKINYQITHVKPHGALNNMACEDFNLAKQIALSIKKFDDKLIFMILPKTQMEIAAKKINIKFACEIFADRNYDDNGLLINRKNKNAMQNDPFKAINNIIQMLEMKSIKTINGKFIDAEIDSVCVHGDGINALKIAKHLKEGLINKGIKLLNLNKLSKFN